jgi:hypothetical protein
MQPVLNKKLSRRCRDDPAFFSGERKNPFIEHITSLAEVRITGSKPSTMEVCDVQIIFYDSRFRRSDGF